MHTVELLEQALAVAESLGYHIRQEYLGGVGGGSCEFGGKRWMFVDLALSIEEQLDEILRALSEDPATFAKTLPRGLEPLIQRAA